MDNRTQAWPSSHQFEMHQVPTTSHIHQDLAGKEQSQRTQQQLK
ncbi:hypothetical protein PXO_05770 [Xanthomonas oryzae pv. oryzae PXO99A]|uniref:Uncharacterized protein n=1 Tax=Xanthomonas oryzae pv. oryzae (strain PXO99A) TaxID=360094 RepID=A0A0K0GQV8_XANOP|nr:hypothetical protein PXO_05770 [Xanthomonas oryzae pv. oryzae PXO99A]